MKNYHLLGRQLSFCLLTTFLLSLGLYGGTTKALSGSISGTVDLDGLPVPGVKINLYLLGKIHAFTSADALGNFKIDGLWMGVYDIEASLGNIKTRIKDVKVKLTNTTMVALHLQSPVNPTPVVVIQEVDEVEDPKEALLAPTISMESLYEESFGDYDDADGSDDFSGDDEGYDQISVQPVDREGYDHIAENIIHRAIETPVSTFAIDVDAASYTNCRRFLLQEQRLPVSSAVRAEEFINYFDYDYPQPTGEHPFSITTEVAACPWNAHNQIVHIGLQGKQLELSALPAANLVFLLDVSGSMDEPNKLPLVKQGLGLLVNQLRPQDRVAIVVYSGAAGLVLPSTSGSQKAKIMASLDDLSAGGSTAGGEGIALAYKTARENMKRGGNNRVILCTDGDFNVGVASDGELVKVVEKERESGVFLSIMGFGTGDYQDAKMEKLADNGNGNYNYIDQLLEAKRVFVNEIGGTLNTIAKDVKIQVEFNPAKVKRYRLIGYENRHLETEDFDNDKKDAGELGAGHSVTALYEIEPTNPDSVATGTLRYQQQQLSAQAGSDELLTVKFRYKAPDGDVSALIEQQCSAQAVALAAASENFRFSAAVAAFAMILRDSQYKGKATYEMVLNLARGAKGQDPDGYRAELIKMVETASLLSGQEARR